MSKILFLILLLNLTALSKPVIGIYTLPAQNTQNLSRTYFASSYVKFVQMSGAMVIPLFYNQSESSLARVLSQINGVLFTGGSLQFQNEHKWINNAELIFKYAMQQNNLGNSFALWGTCMGHQLLSYLTANKDPKMLQRVYNCSWPTVGNATFINKQAELFKGWKQTHFIHASGPDGPLYFGHNWAIYIEQFNRNPLLHGFWDLLATTTDTTGQVYTSIQQAKDYPFYSVQYHPERNPFEWTKDANRNSYALQMTQSLSNVFVEKARQSKNTFNNQSELQRLLIYNHNPQTKDQVFTFTSFTTFYIFDETNLE